MQLQQQISLRPYTTFGVDATAKYFDAFKNRDELEELLAFGSAQPLMVLGGGSNVLFTRNFDGLILKNELKGIDIVKEDADDVYVRAGAGESWHRFVQYCIERSWAGVENLSLIPGHVGASPMQNIGAYGVEVKDVFYCLEAWHIGDKKAVQFTRNDCEFGYRESVFKKKYKGQFVILNVTYQLRKKPAFNTSYGAIEQELEKMGVTELSIRAISDAVIRIRTSKLPNPEEIGNAGSFFKNPEVSVEKYEELISSFPHLVAYPVANGNRKLAAGWMIEQCGPDKSGTTWKGYRRGNAGVHAKQALVLVNYGKATGKEIYDLSEDILQSVKDKFGVVLEREVNII